ncbi:MAG: M15 family metallopeptidase [Candidatus Actinomarina sp.]|nr:M15 family metallopeptidase [Candidatus Actinomarina sp.]
MLSAIATAALINFLILPITYHESEPEYIKNKIENYDYYTISQSGSLFYSVTNQIIESAKNLDSNLTFIGRANIGLESVESSNGENKLSSLENYLYSISIQTIESSKVDFFYNDEVAQVIKDNKLIVSTLTAERYGLSVNDKVSLIGINSAPLVLEVGMIIKDSELSWFEGVVNKEVGFELGIYRNIQAIIWDTKMSENHLIELYKNIEYKRVKITNKHKRNIPNKNWVLPTAMVKEMFGDFQIKERDGTWITTEPSWREKNIQVKKMPILGNTRCHRLMWGPLEGALNQIVDEGLANTLSVEDFKKSGGCYAPRRINRFDAGGSISRHAWGIAIDINTKSNYHPRVVEIFNSWGFAWGGTWTSPDEMHFELRDLSASISKTSS